MSDIDVSELHALARDLGRIAPVVRQVRDVVKKGGVNLKRDWTTNAVRTARKHGKHYPRTVSFDVMALPTAIAVEVGPDKDGIQGPLGNILEFGSVNNPPHWDGRNALRDEEPRFIAAMRQIDPLP